MSKSHKFNTFKKKLEEGYSWPALYMFKFIVPKGKEKEVILLFPRHEFKARESTQGNYVSLTVQLMCKSSDEIIEIYEKAHEIEGLIAL
jgi:uncharacterized protein